MSQKDEQLAIHYLNESKKHAQRNDWIKVLQLCRKAIEIKKRLGQDEDLIAAEAYFCLGCAYSECGDPHTTPREDWNKAEELWQKAKAILGRFGRQDMVASIYFNLGTLHLKQGDIKKLHEHWMFARDIYEEIGHNQMARHIEEQIANLPHFLERIKQAEVWLEKE